MSKYEQVIGFHSPVERDEDEARRAVAKLGEVVGQVLHDTGMSEEGLAALLSLRRPPTGSVLLENEYEYENQ